MSDAPRLRGLATALLLLALASTAAPARAQETTPLEITLNPMRFTGQVVTVHGTLTNLLPRGQMGGPGAVFDVMERGASVRVRSLAPPPCSPGSAVTVNGRVLTTPSPGGHTPTHLIEAFSVSCR